MFAIYNLIFWALFEISPAAALVFMGIFEPWSITLLLAVVLLLLLGCAYRLVRKFRNQPNVRLIS